MTEIIIGLIPKNHLEMITQILTSVTLDTSKEELDVNIDVFPRSLFSISDHIAVMLEHVSLTQWLSPGNGVSVINCRMWVILFVSHSADSLQDRI